MLAHSGRKLDLPLAPIITSDF